MSDLLTQLQNAVDQLAYQFLASFHYVNTRHNWEPLGPNDKVQEVKESKDANDDAALKPVSKEEFRDRMVELARDLVTKEQQIELLISTLPGLENTERDQDRMIRDLEEELKVAEQQRLDARREMEEAKVKMDQELRSIRRC